MMFMSVPPDYGLERCKYISIKILAQSVYDIKQNLSFFYIS